VSIGYHRLSVAGFLGKPVDLEVLARKVGERLAPGRAELCGGLRSCSRAEIMLQCTVAGVERRSGHALQGRAE